MNIQHLKYFLKVAETCHFTRAAEALYVSQPTLSQQIGQLEKELGAPLFDRIGKKVRLTQAGEVFRAYALRALREMDEARVALAELEGLERGALCVGAVQTVNAFLLPEIVARFARAHSGVTLHVEELSGDDIERGLLEGRLNVGIGFVPPASGDIEAQPLFGEELVLAAPTNHRLARRRAVRLHELDGEPLALLSRDFCTRRLFDQSARQAQIAPRVVVEMNSIEALLATVRASGIATVLPALALRGEAERDAAPNANGPCLHAIALSDPTPRRSVGLMWRRHAYRCAATRAFTSEALAVVERDKAASQGAST